MNGVERVERERRTRKVSQRVRVFDEDQRRQIILKRLKLLEDDHWQEERRRDDDAEDEDYVLSASSGDEVAVGTSKRPKKKKTNKKRDAWAAAQQCKSLQEVLDEAQYHQYPSWVPTYLSVAAAPSRYPPRRFCSVSGVAGKYRCPMTGDYLGSLDAYNTHRETRLRGLI
eukprot:CAMPEP_0119373454 /NCGR_PEP_ID=MMETSP1334-20130426/25660_1 /TAXON_ID=127549 /ORGANISM="Calcidiscus leptoporus, Strain RCC1130" /LENGTH=169 /DNA_ID=CAMNT_0007391241 /DNA_START=12 /DNA_END=521 /DNA_ORIENTATION=+